MIYSYKQLIVWQKSFQLVLEIYKITDQFPYQERFGLTSQMRRCSVSIPSNIAEGNYRSTRKDYRQFLTRAFGSGAELETQIAISKNLPFGKNLNFSKADQLLLEVMKMLNKIIHTLIPNP